MKKLAHFFFCSSVILSLYNCAGGKDVLFEKEPPFVVKEAFFQNWVAGTEQGGTGTNVSVILEAILEEIDVKEIYFQNKVTKAVQNPQNIDKYTGFFVNDLKRDVVMDVDPKKESINIPPEKSLFTLSKNEAVISYMHNGEIEYFKITDLIEKPMIAYPGTSPNGKN